MTIPKIEITDIGINAPSVDQINTGVWQTLQAALGDNISQVQGTVQYQLATSFTAMVKDVFDSFIELANQFDPRYASGVYQDAIAELYFISRKLATHSVCPLTFEGLSGSPIPAGFQVQDVAGRLWSTAGAYNIGPSGTVVGTVISDEAGAIEANPNSINIIPSALVGLDSVYNEDSAIVGYAEESRQDFNVRRRESVAINSKMTDDAVRGAVLAIPNVVDCYAISNPTDATVTFGSTSYPAIRNSIVVSVVGGDDYDVAEAAFIKAGTGCSWNGNTPVTVLAQDYPTNPPQYPITILRPTFLDVYIQITVLDINVVTVQDQTAAKDYILSSAASGENKVRINKTFIPAMYMCGVPSIGIVSIKASTDGVTWLDKLEIGLDQYPSLDAFRISIVGA